MLHYASTVTDGIHIIQAWEVANAAARTALVPVATDVGKVALQLDTKTFYVLTNNVGPVWAAINAPASTTALTEGTNLYFTTARVLATVLAGLSTAAGTTVTAAHTILEAMGFLQKQATDAAAAIAVLATTIRGTVLTGLSTAAGTTVTAAHTILEAIGFLQKQVTDNVARTKQYIPIACSDESTALTAGTAKVTFHMPFAMTVSEVIAGLTTVQTSGAIFTVDVNEAGVSIISTKLTIDNTEETSLTAATPPVISDASLAKGAKITIDIDQIGDGTAKGLKVYLVGTVT